MYALKEFAPRKGQIPKLVDAPCGARCDFIFKRQFTVWKETLRLRFRVTVIFFERLSKDVFDSSLAQE